MNDKPARPLPAPTPETRPYWDAAREGRLVYQHCPGCDARLLFPRAFCPTCLSDQLEWVDASGKGQVYSFTVAHRAAHPGLRDRVPYVVAIVELDEGPRLIANILDCAPEAVQVGARVEVTFEPVSEEITLPQFRLSV